MTQYQDEIEAEESYEIALLRDVNEAASDYLLALDNSGFAEHAGGLDSLLERLRIVQGQWETEFNTLPT